MKKIVLTLALVASLLGLGLAAQPAEATHNARFAVVRTFTFQPTFAVQSFAYATFQPFTLVTVPPVVQVQKVEPITVDAFPATTQFLSAGVSTFRVGNSFVGNSFVGFRGGIFNAGIGFDRVRVRSFNAGNATVVQERIVRRGLFGFAREVETKTTVINPGVATFGRIRLR